MDGKSPHLMTPTVSNQKGDIVIFVVVSIFVVSIFFVVSIVVVVVSIVLDFLWNLDARGVIRLD